MRRELATRTVFNVLGPLTNPAGARAQVVGVYAPELVETIASVLGTLGARRAFVVHGAGGIDELSPAGPNLVCEVVDGDVKRREIDPQDFGVPRCSSADLAGGTPDENAVVVREIFAGRAGPEARGGAPERGRRDRGRRARRRPRGGLCASRPRRWTRAPPGSASRSSSPSPSGSPTAAEEPA